MADEHSMTWSWSRGNADFPRKFDPARMQRGACDDCTQGVMDADGPAGPGNDHYYGACKCKCHAPLSEVDALREALRAEQLKFQQETRRTSELTVMLRRVSFEIVSWDGPPGDFTRRALAHEIDALLAKPINAVDPFTASREEVQAELKRRGIDVTEATRKVLDAVHKHGAPPTKAQGERG